ncbi:MAG: hypothetical protein HRU19_22390 [Pseudobacteriovorax sp.]|nr:hypothetical protein [Pseudobacteriovorax sp.]
MKKNKLEKLISLTEAKLKASRVAIDVSQRMCRFSRILIENRPAKPRVVMKNDSFS